DRDAARQLLVVRIASHAGLDPGGAFGRAEPHVVQLGIVVAVVEARGGAAPRAPDPIVVVHAAGREDSDVVVDEAADELRRIGPFERRAISLDVWLDLGVRIARHAEHADTGSPRALERLEVRGRVPQRRMRTLDRPWDDLPRWQIEVLALVAGEVLALEHLHDGRERRAADLPRIVGVSAEAESLDHIRGGPASGAELAAAVAEEVEGGHTLGHHERVVAGHEDHGEPEPDRAG